MNRVRKKEELRARPSIYRAHRLWEEARRSRGRQKWLLLNQASEIYIHYRVPLYARLGSQLYDQMRAIFNHYRALKNCLIDAYNSAPSHREEEEIQGLARQVLPSLVDYYRKLSREIPFLDESLARQVVRLFVQLGQELEITVRPGFEAA